MTTSLFGTAATGTVEQEKDFSKRTLDTDVYAGRIKMAFAGAAESGARSITLQLELDNGKSYDEVIYITNKEGKNTYEKDGKQFYLPGFQLINNMAIMACAKGLHELASEVETKAVKLYNFKEKKEVITDVPAIMPLIGQRVLLAIQEEEYEKKVLNTSTNKYEGTGEYSVSNKIVKIYNPETRQTAVEMRDDAEASQIDSWLDTYKGKIKEAKKDSAAQKGVAAAPKSSGLFG